MDIKRHFTFQSILEAQDPDAAALEFVQQEKTIRWTYAEFLHHIQEYPLPKEQVIGLFADGSVESIVALFALAGKKELVLLSPDDTETTLQAQIDATHVSALIGASSQSFTLNPDKETADTDILFFTSGTTSKAKAVVLTEESLCASAYNGGALLPLSPADRFLSVLPLSHVFGFVCGLLWPLSFGATVCLGRGLRSIFFDFSFFHPTATSLVPQMAGFLVAKNLLNPELKLVLIGAGDCEDAVLAALASKGIRVSFGYGLTETSSGIALSLGEDPRAMSVCPDYRVEIASDGEILVRGGPTFMKGYFEDEAATKATLHDGVLHTGDLGTYDGTFLRLTGRKKEMLVFNDGSKLFLAEYERELAKLLGPGADFAITQNKNGTVVLYVFKPRGVEDIVASFNRDYPRSHQIGKIIYAQEPLPRTKTNKVRRYLIVVE